MWKRGDVTMNPITLLMLIIGVGVSFVWFVIAKDRLHIGIWKALLLAIVHVAIGAVFAKIFAMIDFASFGAFSNWRLYGPVFFLPILYVPISKILKVKYGDVADVFCISAMAALFAFRISCFKNGCCGGIEIFSTGLHWPLRELEMILYIILIAIYAPRILKGQTNGTVYPLFMMVYGIFRFIIEWFREEYVSVGGTIIHTAHVWSIISALIGASVYFTLQAQRGKNNKGKGRRK